MRPLSRGASGSRRGWATGIACVLAASGAGLVACATPSPRVGPSTPASASSSAPAPRATVAAASLERHYLVPRIGLPKGSDRAGAFELVPGAMSGVGILGSPTRFERGDGPIGWATPTIAVLMSPVDVTALDVASGRRHVFPGTDRPPLVLDGKVLTFGAGDPARLFDATTGRSLGSIAKTALTARPLPDGFALLQIQAAILTDATLGLRSEHAGTWSRVDDEGELLQAFSTGGRLRLRRVRGAVVEESPPLPGSASDLSGAPRRVGDVVFALADDALFGWDVRTRRVFTVARGGVHGDLEPTPDGRHLCHSGDVRVVDVAARKEVPHGFCALEGTGDGHTAVKVVELRTPVPLRPIVATGGRWARGFAAAGTFTFATGAELVTLSLPDERELRRVSLAGISFVLPVGKSSVALLGEHVRVVELTPPFREVDLGRASVPSPPFRELDGDAGGLVVETFAPRRPRARSESFAEVSGGKAILTSGGLVDLATGRVTPAPKGGCQHALLSDGSVLDAPCDDTKPLVLRRPDGSTEILPRPPGAVHALRAMQGGGAVLIGPETHVLKKGAPAERIAGLPALGTHGAATRIAPERGEILETTKSLRTAGRVLAVSSDVSRLVTDAGLRTADGHVLSEPPEPPIAAAFSPDGEWVAIASSRRIRVHDARTGQLLLSFASAAPYPGHLAVSRDTVWVGTARGLEGISLVDGAATTLVLDEGGDVVRIAASGATSSGPDAPDPARVVCRRRGARERVVPCE